MKQPRMLSNEEWKVVGEACGFIHKTYEEYREWKQKRVEWEPGMLSWNTERKCIIIFEHSCKLFKNWETTLQPPTQEQLDEYRAKCAKKEGKLSRRAEMNFMSFYGRDNYNRTCQWHDVVHGTTTTMSYEEYIERAGKAEPESEPANTCSPSLVSPADVEEFLEEHKAEKKINKPSHEYKAKDTVMWDGMGYRDNGLVDKITDPCEVKIIEVLSTSSVFDYEIRHNGIGWRVYANQLTPIPDKKSVKVGNIVWNSQWDEVGIVTAVGHSVVGVKTNNGRDRAWVPSDLSHATPEQVAQYYTVTIDGVWYRFYKCSGILYATGTTMEDNKKEPMIGLSLMSFLIRALINQHYKHLVLSVDDVEEMIPPTKGDE